MVPLCSHQKDAGHSSTGKTYVLRPISHHHDVMNTLNEQRKRGDKNLCDVTLAVEGSLMLAHKAVLVTCSSYFKNRFEDKKQGGKSTSGQKAERALQVQIPTSKTTMSPPVSPLIKRRRNAMSECIPESASISSPVSPHTTRTPPPQSFKSSLRAAPTKLPLTTTGEVVVLPGLKSKAFSQILDYMYTAELRITKENVQDLLLVSCLLQIKTIVDACVQVLTKENKWKISTSSFCFAKKFPNTPSTSRLRLNGRHQNGSSIALLQSPNRSVEIENVEVESEKELKSSKSNEDSTNQLKETSEKKDAISFAHPHHHDQRRDVIRHENQRERRSCAMAEASLAVTREDRPGSSSPETQCVSGRSSQQLDVSLKKERKYRNFASCKDVDERLPGKAFQEKLNSCSPRIHSSVDDLRLSRDENVPLDLSLNSLKKQIIKNEELLLALNTTRNNQEIDDAECKKSLPKLSLLNYPKSETSSEVSESKDSKENQRKIFDNSLFSSSEISKTFPHLTDSTSHYQQAFSSLNMSPPHLIPPPLHALPAPLGLRPLFKDLNSQNYFAASEALKQVNLLANVPGLFPGFVWKDSTKFISLDRLSTLMETPLQPYDAFQRSWPGCFEHQPILKSEPLPPQPLSRSPPSSVHIPSGSLDYSFQNHSLQSLVLDSTASGKYPFLTSHKLGEQEQPPHSESNFLPSKHLLKRKLISADVDTSESFQANLNDGEPPQKSPKSISPAISRFEPLRVAEQGSSSRQQQCCV